MEDLLEKESLFKEMDQLIEDRDKALEVVLKEILPAAFAVVKETARRFMENETLTVTANPNMIRPLPLLPGKHISALKMVKPSGRMNGLPPVEKSNGTCCITMCS